VEASEEGDEARLIPKEGGKGGDECLIRVEGMTCGACVGLPPSLFGKLLLEISHLPQNVVFEVRKCVEAVDAGSRASVRRPTPGKHLILINLNPYSFRSNRKKFD